VAKTLLLTEQNTPQMGDRVLRAFCRQTWGRKWRFWAGKRVAAVFEHGQWWIIDRESGAHLAGRPGVGRGFAYQVLRL